MNRPVVWMEIRCDLFKARDCEEGLEGFWGNTARQIDKQIKAAQRLGWKIIDGDMVCPECALIAECDNPSQS